MSDDMRDYYKFYGVYTDDWTTTWGGNTYNRHLVKTMIGACCSYATSSTWNANGREFIYPHHIKKTYFLEGVIEGEIAFGRTVASCVSDYRVSIFKLNTDTTKTTLAQTNIISVNDYIAASDIVTYHYWIDVYEKKELSEYDRIGIKIEWNVSNGSTVTAYLLHDVTADQTCGYDLWVDIPFML